MEVDKYNISYNVYYKYELYIGVNMLRHSKCFYKDRLIGIESIFTAKDGKLINIPEYTEWLREQGRRGNLFCDCGCGATLILVAGDRQINADGEKKGRRQHFRIKTRGHRECTSTEESEETLFAKITLKGWLCDKLSTDDVKMNVPINTVSESDRRYEYTLYDEKSHIGLLFWKNRKNILDERIKILEEGGDKKIICVVGAHNDVVTGQYQEYMIKVQKKQGYCLFINLPDDNCDQDYGEFYKQAVLKASIFCENCDGEWQEICLAEGNITDYFICKETGFVSYLGVTLKHLSSEAEIKFFNEQELIKKKRYDELLKRKEAEEEYRARLERIEKEREEQERKRIEREKQRHLEAKEKFLTYCNEQDIIEVSLLTKEEAQHIRKSFLSLKKHTWWLSTKGPDSNTVNYVYDDGTIEYGDVHYRRGIRPVLRLKENLDEPCNVGDSFEFAGHWFTLVNGNLALCDDCIGYETFRKEVDVIDANDFTKSDVKKYIEDWCIVSFM